MRTGSSCKRRSHLQSFGFVAVGYQLIHERDQPPYLELGHTEGIDGEISSLSIFFDIAKYIVTDDDAVFGVSEFVFNVFMV